MTDVGETIAAHWDGRAATFDDEPDHGLADASTRDAWRRRLSQWLPQPPVRVADLGCGTGSLVVLLATMGYEVTASDISPAMVPDPHAALDRWAALLRPAGRLVMVEGRWGTPSQDDEELDATGHGDYSAVHHALPWYGGVDAETLAAELERRFARVDLHDLSGEAVLWGREVADKRFAVVGHNGTDGHRSAVPARRLPA